MPPGGYGYHPGYGPGGWPPPAPPKKGRNALGIGIAIGCILAILVSVTVLWRTRTTGPDHPDAWDPRVADAVAFVEKDKGRPFDHPVYVDFLPEDQFRARVESEPSEVTDDDRAAADQQEGMLRALGLVQGDVDLLAEHDTVASGGTAAFYDPGTQHVYVRGTSLTPDIEGTVVHELTHAWQDQHYDLNRLDSFPTAAQAANFRMIAEGDAVMTENDWLDTLTDDERDTYDQLSKEASDQAGDELSSVPDVLVAQFGAPYEFGEPFLTGLRAIEGSDYLDVAFGKPPETDEQILRPDAYLDHESANNPAGNGGPDTEGQESVDDGTFGALFWYLVLADRIDPLTALHAVDGWDGDSYAVYEKDGTTCVAAEVVGDDAEATAALSSALTDWAATLPDASAETVGDEIHVRACDPGPDATFDYAGRSTKVIGYPVIRLIIWSQGLVQGQTREEADCYSNAFVEQLGIDELSASSPLSDDRVLELHQGAATACPS